MPRSIHREGPLAHRARPCAHAARAPVKRDAPFRVERQAAQVNARPPIGRHLQSRRGASRRARHVRAGDAGTPGRFEGRRARRQSLAGRELGDGVYGTDVDARSAPRTGREEGQLGPRARRTKVTGRGDPALGSSGHLAGQLRERVAEEGPPFRLVQLRSSAPRTPTSGTSCSRWWAAHPRRGRTGSPRTAPRTASSTPSA